MAESRRTFLESIGAYLASLPFAGCLAVPALSLEEQWANGADIPCPESLCPPKPGDWLSHSDGRLIAPLEHMASNGLGIIRWIPVTERVPDAPQSHPYPNGLRVDITREVIVSNENGVCSARLWKHFAGDWNENSWLCDNKGKNTTHWAEMPSGPSDSQQDQNHTALYQGISLSDSREGVT